MTYWPLGPQFAKFPLMQAVFVIALLTSQLDSVVKDENMALRSSAMTKLFPAERTALLWAERSAVELDVELTLAGEDAIDAVDVVSEMGRLD